MRAGANWSDVAHNDRRPRRRVRTECSELERRDTQLFKDFSNDYGSVRLLRVVGERRNNLADYTCHIDASRTSMIDRGNSG